MVRIPELSEIRKLRENLSLSQRQLAKMCNIQPPFLNMIENGHSEPSYKVFVKIFQVLDAESEKSNKLTSARDICTKNLITARKTDYIEDIIKIMKTKNISQIPVIDSEGCIGIVTENSIVKGIKENNKVMTRAKDVMETPPPSIDVDTKITKNILDLLGDARCIIVTDKARPYGIITKMDAIKSLMK